VHSATQAVTRLFHGGRQVLTIRPVSAAGMI
jgi:hypothetical protein